MEPKRFEILQDKVTLRRLIELELDHLWAVFRSPKVGDLGNRFDGYTAFFVLFEQELIRIDANHQLHLGI
jgi:hypothetical protein